MVLKQGNLWDAKTKRILVTTNCSLRKDGALVMGRGAASEAKVKYPGCALRFGTMIDNFRALHGNLVYGVILDPESKLGIFQVKYSFWESASLYLIENSVESLVGLHTLDPGVTYAMNFPGIGNGKLSRASVLPLLKKLPDTVEVWEWPK